MLLIYNGDGKGGERGGPGVGVGGEGLGKGGKCEVGD